MLVKLYYYITFKVLFVLCAENLKMKNDLRKVEDVSEIPFIHDFCASWEPEKGEGKGDALRVYAKF